MKKAFKAFFGLLGVLLGAALIFLAVSLFLPEEPGGGNAPAGNAASLSPSEPVSEMTGTDPEVLLSAFGSRVPLPGGTKLLQGRIDERDHGGEHCAVMTLSFEGGMTLRAVRPETGAPLLLPEGMTVQNIYPGFSLKGLSCIYMTGRNGCCCLFSDNGVSVCLMLENAGAGEMAAALERF